MSELLPLVFVVIASATLLTALFHLWMSFRAAFGTGDAFHLPSAEAESRRILEERKNVLLSNLADLEFEHAADKISDADYELLDKKLRAEAKGVLRLLDQDVRPYRQKAEKRLKEALKERGTPYRDRVASDTSAAAESAKGPSTENEIDAKVDEIVADLVLGGPLALAASKQLINDVPSMDFDQAMAFTTRLSGSLFESDEGQEGMKSYLEKRPPRWAQR